MYNKTIIINLFAGPGAGKSVMASEIYSKLKRLGLDAELTGEYAKDKVWEDSLNVLNNQIYIFAKQHHRIFRLKNKVQFVVTDSPILMGIVYDNTHDSNLKNLVVSQFRTYDNVNFFIKRNLKNFNQNGRNQNLEESIIKDGEILQLLKDYDIEYTVVNDSEHSVDEIIKKCIEKFND